MALSEVYRGAASAGGEFASTHWTVVLMAGTERSPQSAAALEKLCQAYWYPLYTFARRRGCGPSEAADLTQEFFSHLLETNALASVDRTRGKFRSFLLASFKNLIANEWQYSRRQKRGGGAIHFSLDEAAAEGRFVQEPTDQMSPDKVFDRGWAETILSRALKRLREECDGQEKERRFDEVKVFLLGDKEAETMAEVAARLNMTLSGIKALVHRLRRRFRELIRSEVAETVSSPAEVDQEIRELFAAFGR